MSNPLKEYAKYLLGKCQGDTEFAKKITLNNAELASYEGNEDRLDSEAEIWHHLKVIAKNKKASLEVFYNTSPGYSCVLKEQHNDYLFRIEGSFYLNGTISNTCECIPGIYITTPFSLNFNYCIVLFYTQG